MNAEALAMRGSCFVCFVYERSCCQWRTQKIFMGRCLVQGHLVCAVCNVTLWRHFDVSKPPFWRSLLTQYAYFSTSTPLILCVIALNINYQRSKLGYRRRTNSTLRHSSS